MARVTTPSAVPDASVPATTAPDPLADATGRTHRTGAALQESAATPRLGLRERKKIQTRRAIRQAAFRLFAEHGYDATAVDRIAEAAEVSTSTVFRYYPTKEDIVLTDEYDPMMAEALLRRPAGEAPATAVRHALTDLTREVWKHQGVEITQRLRLVCEVPAVRARLIESVAVTGRALARALAQRTGRPADDLELQVFVGAVVGGLVQAILCWDANGRTGELVHLLDRALALLENGLRL
ncbi:TetR family transcriptional regulator [Streptomyces sp. AJS327]|uniref:TetR/AcrR family transcriptional regulator n=1 Tax=Streptomyces sp. AJS327 TaxID=2545265 RepID=UPI0015DFA879|nr:TetR family transcriptional regulator [Streptomyces sp. AJS327]MBA0051291.1 TetR family transcriptional regulator [Streptomyces sp. AJS327]